LEVTIHDRQHILDDSLQSYVTAKVASLSKHFNAASSAEVEFDTDFKNRRSPQHVAKITLHLVGHRLSDLRAHSQGPLARVAFDLAFGVLRGELARVKERVEAHPTALPELPEA
jgi:ribosomal subunit interface protein